MRLVITGNPGVGKHTTTELVAKKLPDTPIVDINRIVVDNKAVFENNDENNGTNQYGIDIDVYKTKQLLAEEIKSKQNVVIVGHLAPYVLKAVDIDLVVVLRRSPYQLKEILQGRRYTPIKINENIACEILGITLYDALNRFGKRKVIELDTSTRSPNNCAEEIVSLLQNKSKPKPFVGAVDWLSLVYEKGDTREFLEY
jgi:adenylate kinase